MSAERYFVDSNVLLYCVDPIEPGKREQALLWIDALWRGGTGVLSWQVLHEFYWNSVRKMGLEPSQARSVVEDLSLWRPVDTSLGLIRQAWRLADENQLPYWDALIVAAAERAGARFLLSEDFQEGRKFGDVTIVNPFVKEPGPDS